MKVKAIYKNWASLPSYFVLESDSPRLEYQINNRSDYDLELEKEYIVYGMTIRDNFTWYFICEESTSRYPGWYPSPFFEVIDSSLSRFWIYTYKKLDNYITQRCVFSFPEWANNHPDFYDRLTDWEEEETAIFKKYKELMDLEFEDPAITEYAQQEEDGWLICWSCYEAWQLFNTLDALIKCPKCEKILNNPRYVKSEYSLARSF